MKEGKRWSIVLVAFFIFFASEASLSMGASDFPNRPIEITLPNAPGGGMDFIFTLFKDKVEKVLKQPIIFTYKAGAAGMTGTLYAKACKPDGYSLLAASISTFILPPLTRKAAEYTLDDFTAICNLTTIPQAFCVKEDSPYKTMQEFIQAAKTKKMKYGTHGAFTTAHICMEALGKAAGFQAIHIPYKGAAAGMTAALGGHVDMAISGTTSYVGPGKLRLLAIAADKRLDGFPNVPTLKDLGYSVTGQVYYSLWGPKGIPREITGKIYEGYKKALEENREEITRLAREQEHTILFYGGDELRSTYQTQSDFYKKMLLEMGGVK
jgi:tripartite-type tricarboxylate transporter receptor subunit TctC